MPSRLPLIPVLVLALAALAFAAPATAGSRLLVGAADDLPKQIDPIAAKTKMDMARLAGMNAIRLSSTWSRGETEPTETELLALQNATAAANLNGITVYLSIFWMSRNTPLTQQWRTQYAEYVASLLGALPSVEHVIIGNENNLNLFWMPQFDARGRDVAASGYTKVLAEAYDAVKAVSPSIEVVGGAISPRGEDKPQSRRHTQSPVKFIASMGRTYRALRRTTPIMDAFGIHPYAERSIYSPLLKHTRSTRIGLADYGKLVGLLKSAFKGTAQPTAGLPIVYDEFGVQSRIPSGKASKYSNGAAPGAADAVNEKLQATYYRQALELAACQPNVTAMLFFLFADEPDLTRWQSGIYYVDGTPKSSFPGVKRAIHSAKTGKVRCAKIKTRAKARKKTSTARTNTKARAKTSAARKKTSAARPNTKARPKTAAPRKARDNAKPKPRAVPNQKPGTKQPDRPRPRRR